MSGPDGDVPDFRHIAVGVMLTQDMLDHVYPSITDMLRQMPMPIASTSMRPIRYVQPGSVLDPNVYDGGTLLDDEHEPVPLRPIRRRPWRDELPTRIVEVRPNVVDLAADEAAILARSKRCACGHLDVFHTRDSEWGTSCIGECECTDLRTALNPQPRRET